MEDWLRRRMKNKYGKDVIASAADIVQKFKQALPGDERRVQFSNGIIELLFSSGNTEEFLQFNALGVLLNEEKITYNSDVVKGDKLRISIPLSKKQDLLQLNALVYIAEQLKESNVVKAEISPIIPTDPEYTLVSATGIPWNRVKGSAYEVDTLEPARDQPISEYQRQKEESALGLLINPPETFSPKQRVEDWLAHQHRIEAQKNVQVHTAIPNEWADHGHAERLAIRTQQLRKVFSKA